MSLTPTFSAATTGIGTAWASGDCPECGGITIPLIGRGELAPHRQYVIRGGRMVESDTPCEGSYGPTAEDLEARPRKNRSSTRKRGTT